VRVTAGEAPAATPDSTPLALGAWLLIAAVVGAGVRARVERLDALVVAAAAVFFGDIVLAAGVDDPGTGLWVLVPASLLATAVRYAAPGPRTIVFTVLATWSTAAATFVALIAVPPVNLHIFEQASTAVSVGVLLAAWICVGALAWVLHARDIAADPNGRTLMAGVFTTLALLVGYAVSIAVVGVLSDTPREVDQQAQLALTVSWGVMALFALFAGTSARLRHLRPLRVGAFALLGVAALKVVTFDTAELEPPMRVLTFLLTGMLLLGGAALEQRMRGVDAPPPASR